MTFTVEYEREDDGRWLAEVIELPGVLAYGQTSDEATQLAAEALPRCLLGALIERAAEAYQRWASGGVVKTGPDSL